MERLVKAQISCQTGEGASCWPLYTHLKHMCGYFHDIVLYTHSITLIYLSLGHNYGIQGLPMLHYTNVVCNYRVSTIELHHVIQLLII